VLHLDRNFAAVMGLCCVDLDGRKTRQALSDNTIGPKSCQFTKKVFPRRLQCLSLNRRARLVQGQAYISSTHI
jgi:hypothetical protein